MSLDHRLINLLVCPLCKGALQMQRDAALRPQALVCPVDRLAYPIRDGVPILIESEAHSSDAAEAGPPTPTST
jgi:uncharacterized protein YbaR (Trm112 family)